MDVSNGPDEGPTVSIEAVRIAKSLNSGG